MVTIDTPKSECLVSQKFRANIEDTSSVPYPVATSLAVSFPLEEGISPPSSAASMTLRTTTTATTTPNLIATPSNSTFFVTLFGKNPHNDLIKSRRLSPPALFPSPNTSLNHGLLRKRHRFIPKARSSSLSEAVELPLLPFPMDQVLVPSESRTLHLYEARYLALLDKVKESLQFLTVIKNQLPSGVIYQIDLMV
ncbi:hypothetical protein Vadar_014541 [Vaccinium darrowii]|uniref:Uncharacterized protein n=1 Tax=Vaccinium darrowii TaxID=229202 RepID=A0ACB7X129_9ERIC|nr:hypothetical protein Vadar_014541 [Vaccinium darrowii]